VAIKLIGTFEAAEFEFDANRITINFGPFIAIIRRRFNAIFANSQFKLGLESVII